jgi:hypothetical protein
MGFQLVIAEGREAGREFVFDQNPVIIGRTPECDVILYDAGVSRQHARIVELAGDFWLEDMGSSNGTLVNGCKVERQLLKEGDCIALGGIVFSFRPAEVDEARSPDAPAGGPHTRILSMAELKRSRNKGVALLPEGAGRSQLDELGGRKTKTIRAAKARPAALPATTPDTAQQTPGDPQDGELALGTETSADDTHESAALFGFTADPRAWLARWVQAREIPAAERARLRRQGLIGRGKLWWAGAAPGTRAAAIGATGLVGIAVLGGIIAAFMPPEKPKLVEPVMLKPDATPYSFGFGPTVTFEHLNQKLFEFEVKSAARMIGVVHFQSRDIDDDEVSVTVNGTELGWVPRDLQDAEDREHEVIIPASIISRTAINILTFDHVRDSRQKDPWRVSHVWLELSVLPEKDEEGLAYDAGEALAKATQKWAQKDIGAPNRWEAYKLFREAWLTLEALPPSRRPQTYELARQRMLDVRKDLDRTCKALLLEVFQAHSQKQDDATRSALDHVADYFPSRQHPCQALAEAERAKYEL